MNLITTSLATTLLFAATGAQAQVMRPVLDHGTAEAIRSHCLARAGEAGHSVAIAIFDHGGNLVSFANAGASQAAAAVAQWKGRSAALYLRPTLETGAWDVPNAPMISTMEGGVPLFAADGTGIGGVGVSGAPSAFDAACASQAAESVGLAVARK